MCGQHILLAILKMAGHGQTSNTPEKQPTLECERQATYVLRDPYTPRSCQGPSWGSPSPCLHRTVFYPGNAERACAHPYCEHQPHSPLKARSVHLWIPAHAPLRLLPGRAKMDMPITCPGPVLSPSSHSWRIPRVHKSNSLETGHLFVAGGLTSDLQQLTLAKPLAKGGLQPPPTLLPHKTPGVGQPYWLE